MFIASADRQDVTVVDFKLSVYMDGDSGIRVVA